MATLTLTTFAGPGDTVEHLGPRPGSDAGVRGGLTLCGLFLEPMDRVTSGPGNVRRLCRSCAVQQRRSPVPFQTTTR